MELTTHLRNRDERRMRRALHLAEFDSLDRDTLQPLRRATNLALRDIFDDQALIEESHPEER